MIVIVVILCVEGRARYERQSR